MENTPCFHGWKIVRRIGGGHFGAVYEIEKEESGSFSTSVEHSAMKVISIPPSEDELESLQAEYGDDATVTTLLRSQVDDITEEFKLMSKLQGQSNIVSYHDHEIVQQDNGLGWDVLIRMELLTSLSAHSNEHAMDKNEIVRLGIDICKALERCEMHNILHRDIKPQNIFVNADGDFKLGDFGVARVSEHMTASTVAGTYTYMAPEVYQNKENYDKRADIYSLGLVLYWLLNERRDPFLPLPPATFTSKDKNAAFQKRIEGVSLPRPAHGSPKLQAVVLRACAFKREDRFANAAEMRKALESLSAGEKTHMEIKEPPVPEIHTDSPKIGSDDETVDGRDKVSEKASGKPNSSAGKLGDTVSAFHRANDETVYDAKSESQEPEPVKKEAYSGKQPKKSKTPLLIAAACVAVALIVVLVVALNGNTTPSTATTDAANLSDGLEYETYSDHISVTGYNGNSTEVVIPAEVDGLPVTTIELAAFRYCTSLTSVTIPDSVTYIGSYAFGGCTSLTNVTIPGSVTNIESYAFSSCTALSSITLSDCITAIGSRAFSNCTSLTGITIPDSVTNIGSYAFADCTYLTSITLSDSLTAIGESAFSGCTLLTSIIIPDGVTTIGENAFEGCTSLTSVTIPNSVTTIGNFAFGGCTSLTSITIPDGVIEIGQYTFSGCTSLTSITIPDGVIVIGQHTFSGCTSLTSVIIPDSVMAIAGSAFEGCTSLKSVSVPAETEIEENAFPSTTTVTRVNTTEATAEPDGAATQQAQDGIMTHSEFEAAELGSEVCVETYVQATQSWWDNTINVYAQSKDGAYFIYGMTCSEADASKLTEGTKIRVTGSKSEWGGELEITDGTFDFIDGDTYVAEATNLTELWGTDELLDHQNGKVSFKGVTVEAYNDAGDAFSYGWGGSGAAGTNSDLYFNVSRNGTTYTFIVESELCEEGTYVYTAVTKLQVGDVIDLEGFLYWYNEPNMHVTAVTVTG